MGLLLWSGIPGRWPDAPRCHGNDRPVVRHEQLLCLREGIGADRGRLLGSGIFRRQRRKRVGESRSIGAEKIAPALLVQHVEHEAVWLFQAGTIGDVEPQAKRPLAREVVGPERHAIPIGRPGLGNIERLVGCRPAAKGLGPQGGEPGVALGRPGRGSGGRSQGRVSRRHE